MIGTTEQEDYDNLVKSPGWQRLVSWADAELAQTITAHTATAAGQDDDIKALHQLRQILVAKKYVDLVLSHPTARLRELQAKAAGATRLTLTRAGV